MKSLAEPSLIGDFKKKMGGGSLSHENLLQHVSGLMVTAGKIKNMSGEEKKMVVVKTIKDFMAENECDLPPELADTLVPEAIDLFVDISKGTHVYKKVTKGCCR